VLLLLTYKSLSVATVYLPYYPGARPYHIVERMLGETGRSGIYVRGRKGVYYNAPVGLLEARRRV